MEATAVVRLTRVEGGLTTVSDEAVGQLRSRLRGRLWTANEPGADPLRPVFNAMHDAEPGLTVSCVGTADVVQAVNFARENGLLVAVRGGGHSIAGLSNTDGGMLLDLSPMRGVLVHPERNTAEVQGGALWGDVDHETQLFGLATPGGIVSDTGVAGLTLGGGYGWIRRKYGLSCDNLVEAQVVCADGSVRRASSESHPDLYWALRGGGGNFGIVTTFTFRLHPVGPVVAFAGTIYEIDDIGKVLRGWGEYTREAPDEVTSSMAAITFPALPEVPDAVHHRACAVVAAVYAGDVDEGMKVLEPLRRLASPIVDLSGPWPYSVVQSAFDVILPRHEVQSYWSSQYVDDLSDEVVEVLSAITLDRPAPLVEVGVWHLEGAISRVDPEETAFAQRSAPFLVSIEGNWHDSSFNHRGIAWVRAAHNRVHAVGTGAGYLNFTGLDGGDVRSGVDAALGRNLDRLAAVKAIYDAQNFFRLNNNIAPAPS